MHVARRAHAFNLEGPAVCAELNAAIRQHLTATVESMRSAGGEPTAQLFINTTLNGTPEHALQVYNRALAGKQAGLSRTEVFSTLQDYATMAEGYVVREREVFGYTDAVPAVSRSEQLPEVVGAFLDNVSVQLLRFAAEPIAAVLAPVGSKALPLGIMPVCSVAAATAREAIALKYGHRPKAIEVPALLPLHPASPAPTPTRTPPPVGASS